MNTSIRMNLYRRARQFFCAVLVLGLSVPFSANSAGPVLMQGAGITVTTEDVLSEMQQMPDELQHRLLITPKLMQQLVDKIYLRRAATQIAEQRGLAQTSDVKAKLQLARENILGQAWIATIDASVQPTQDVLEKYAQVTYRAEPKRFEVPAETHARHILILGSTPDSKAKAEKILADIKAGSDFEEQAKLHSGDPGSAAKGGDLGWFPMGRMVKEFDEAVQTLQNPGDLSTIVASKFGYHIIKLEGRRPAKMRDYSEVREQLLIEAKAKMQREARENAISQLQSQGKGDETALQTFIDAQKALRK